MVQQSCDAIDHAKAITTEIIRTDNQRLILLTTIITCPRSFWANQCQHFKKESKYSITEQFHAAFEGADLND